MIKSYFLARGGEVVPVEQVHHGGAIVWRSNAFDNTSTDRTDLNIMNEKDVLLQISIQLEENRVVLNFNSRVDGEDWGLVEAVTLDDLFTSTDSSVVVFDAVTHYLVLCSSKLVYEFRKRIDKPMNAVNYDINQDQRSPFSDVLVVSTIDSLSSLLRKSRLIHPFPELDSSIDENETVTMECTINHRAGLIALPGESFKGTDRLGFEYAEHSWLGDAICLSLEDGQRIVAKKRPIALPNGLNLTYGEINGLAGDFYGTTKPISDGSDADEQTQRFVDAYGKLSTDTTRQPDEAKSILHVLQKEVDAVNNALANHEDPSVAYSKLPDETWAFQKITLFRPSDEPSYIGLAQINWDHFGKDARTTYNAGHAKALGEAAKGNLMEAYALNAFADHFLEDSFSAGHLRTPRRMLHGREGMKDLLAKYMHDEDCAIGLSVTNPAGESWQAFGDKRLLDRENNDNKERCLAAIQASADEVFQAYQTREVPSPDNYKAWTHACTLDSAHGDQELVPLFKEGENRRKDVTHRREREFTQDWWVWSTVMQIYNSGLWKYPITIDPTN